MVRDICRTRGGYILGLVRTIISFSIGTILTTSYRSTTSSLVNGFKMSSHMRCDTWEEAYIAFWKLERVPGQPGVARYPQGMPSAHPHSVDANSTLQEQLPRLWKLSYLGHPSHRNALVNLKLAQCQPQLLHRHRHRLLPLHLSVAHLSTLRLHRLALFPHPLLHHPLHVFQFKTTMGQPTRSLQPNLQRILFLLALTALLHQPLVHHLIIPSHRSLQPSAPQPFPGASVPLHPTTSTPTTSSLKPRLLTSMQVLRPHQETLTVFGRL